MTLGVPWIAGARESVFSDYGSLSSWVSAAGRMGHLYTKGAEGNDASRIGTWIYDSGVSGPVPIGDVDLSLVTDSQYATIASGTGGTRTVDTGHNLPASATVTVWDTSAGSAIASGVAITVSGDTVTFTAGDPGATAAGDLIHVEGTCEFGELLTEGNGGLWVPTAGALPVWSSGLKVSGGGVSLLIGASTGGDTTPRLFNLHGAFDIENSSAGANSAVGVGFRTTRAGSTYANAGGLKNSSGTWQRSLLYADFEAATGPAIIASSNSGTPSSEADVVGSVHLAESTTSNASWMFTCNGGALTAGSQDTGDAGAWSSFSLGSNGSPDAFFVFAKAITSGTLEATFKHISCSMEL